MRPVRRHAQLKIILLAAAFGAKTNLLSMWTNQMKSNVDQRREEFDGRKNAVEGKTELYQDLNKDMNIARYFVFIHGFS